MNLKMPAPVRSESPCAICGTRYVVFWSKTLQLHLCNFHGMMSTNGINAVLPVIQNPGRRISKELFNAGRWNSYDRYTMAPYFSDELLIEQTEFTLANCSSTDKPPTHMKKLFSFSQ